MEANEVAERVEQRALTLATHLRAGDVQQALEAIIALRGACDWIGRELWQENIKPGAVTPAKPVWQISLRPPTDANDPQGVHRMRAALKCLLRSFQLTATSVIKIDSPANSVPANLPEASEVAK